MFRSVTWKAWALGSFILLGAVAADAPKVSADGNHHRNRGYAGNQHRHGNDCRPNGFSHSSNYFRYPNGYGAFPPYYGAYPIYGMQPFYGVQPYYGNAYRRPSTGISIGINTGGWPAGPSFGGGGFPSGPSWGGSGFRYGR